MSNSIRPFLKAIIFDVDGTLAETEEVHRQAFNAAFRTFGLPWQWDVETYRGLLSIGGGRERFQAFLAQMGVRRIDPVLVANLHQEKSRLYAARVAAGHLHARPGVLRLLAEARAAGIRLACATSSQRSAVTALLPSLLGSDAENTFTALGCGDDAARKKPAPDIYLWVLEQLSVERPSCIVIEDTALGLAAATAAGLSTVITVSMYSEPFNHEPQSFAEAVAVVSDLGEPNRQFTLLAGKAYGRKIVDLSLLQLWLAKVPDPMTQ
ncbi:MAG: HAD family hydrolase [Rhodospirillaceae bacterium]|nr:MAG: HAD family hydrolase [Rhodospirillaceae bacterium]